MNDRTRLKRRHSDSNWERDVPLLPPASNVDAPGDPGAALRLHVFEEFAQHVNATRLSNQTRMHHSRRNRASGRGPRLPRKGLCIAWMSFLAGRSVTAPRWMRRALGARLRRRDERSVAPCKQWDSQRTFPPLRPRPSLAAPLLRMRQSPSAKIPRRQGREQRRD
jgi:hypothetical protein